MRKRSIERHIVFISYMSTMCIRSGMKTREIYSFHVSLINNHDHDHDLFERNNEEGGEKIAPINFTI